MIDFVGVELENPRPDCFHDERTNERHHVFNEDIHSSVFYVRGHGSLFVWMKKEAGGGGFGGLAEQCTFFT